MRKRLMAVLTVLVIVCIAGRANSQTLKCKAADQTSSDVIAELKYWMSATNAEFVYRRDSVFMIPVVSASQISVVTAETTCQKLVMAYALLPKSYTPPSLYVVKLGNKGYAVLDPTDLTGDQRTVMIFDTKFKRVGGYTGP